MTGNVDVAPRLERSAAPTFIHRVRLLLRKSLFWAWLDTVCHYRRSRIGPLWETINVAVMIAGLTLVSSAIFGGSFVGQVGYIGIGIIVWSAISALIIEGSTIFVKFGSLITNTNIDIEVYIGRIILKVLISFGHHLIIYVIGVAFLIVPVSWTSLLALVGMVLLFVNGCWIATVLSFMHARYRDVEPIVRNLLQLAFFVTPVFWNYQQIASDRRFLIEYNLLFYFIEIIRSPLLGQVPPLRYYLIVVVVTALGAALAVFISRRMRRQLAFLV